MSTATPSKTPVHLWIVGVVTLLWNAIGALDYFMTQTQNADYMADFSAEQLEFFYGLPGWVVSFWAIAVWGGLLGSLLLLLRKGLAVPVLLASFFSMLMTTIHNFGFSNGLEVMGSGGAIFSAVIFVVALGLLVYARAMRARGVLR
jgi:hypothetical protein